MSPQPDDKLRAEWFWCDRWDGSSGRLLPIAARGLYREMLTQAWSRGARLPNDPETIQRACAVTKAEWRANWPKVRPFWREVDDGRFLEPLEDLGGSRVLPGQTAHRPHVPVEIRRMVFERDGFACCFCGALDRLELDHIVPFSQGGADTADNLRVLCRTCNASRGART